MKRPPSILFICTDQQRADSLGCFGNPVARTPHLDRLARRGTIFRCHATPNQICSPSRATKFTGLRPRRHGLTANGRALPPDVPVLPRILADAGYRTFVAGKVHLAPELAPAEYGIPESRPFWQTNQARDWHGPYYGFQDAELIIGLGVTSVLEGHYGDWLRRTQPAAARLILEEAALAPSPLDLEECWKSAMPVELHYNTWIFDRAIDYLRKVEPPFFGYVSTPDPHHPFTPPAPYCDLYDPAAVPMPRYRPGELDLMPAYVMEKPPANVQALDAPMTEQGALLPIHDVSEASLRLAIAHTYGMVTMIDDNVGRLLDALDARGLSEETIVVFTTDHGELLGDHGLLRKGPPPYRVLREVSLIIAGLSALTPTVDSMTDHTDLTPTLLDYANIDLGGLAMDGVSLRPVLEGRAASVRDERFAEYHAVLNPEVYNTTIETEDWRLTLYPQQPAWGELFDLTDDPGEHRNLFHDGSAADVVASLRLRLMATLPPAPLAGSEFIAKY